MIQSRDEMDEDNEFFKKQLLRSLKITNGYYDRDGVFVCIRNETAEKEGNVNER